MRLNATGTKLAKTLKKPLTKPKAWATCGEELAAAFSACKGGTYKPQGFRLNNNGLQYDEDEDSDEFCYDQQWYIEFNGFADNCGILIIGALQELPQNPAVIQAVLRAAACGGRGGNFGMMLASVNHRQTEIIKALKAFGMKELFGTHNPNSTNEITLYGKDITGVKDTLGIGNDKWDFSARNWLRVDDY